MHAIASSLEACFGELADPRVVGRCDHQLLDIIIIAVCAVITGAESWVKVETFGQLKQDWLKTFLELPNGIPSHDTFGRVFATFNAEVSAHHLQHVLETLPVVPIPLFWDRATWHRDPPIHELLARNPRLAIIEYPVAAPDLCRVWKEIRNKVMLKGCQNDKIIP